MPAPMSAPMSPPAPAKDLVLVPGLLCTADLFRSQIAALDKRGCAVHVADHAKDASVAAIAGRILADAPPRFALAGLSMGGYVAFEILRQAPERVERLALLDTSARPDMPEQSENRRRLVALAEKKGVSMPAREMFAKLVAPSRADDAELLNTFLAMAEATGTDGFARQQTAIAARPDSRPTLAAVSCPTLVLVGAEDQLTPPPLAEEIAKGIPGARLAVIPGAGHLSTLEAPDALNDALAGWLAQI